MPTPSRTLLLFALGLALPIAPAHARGECAEVPLVSGVSQVVPSAATCRYEPSSTAWSAIGVRPTAGDDWTLTAHDASAPAPDCVGPPVATSATAGSAVDFVVGDFNHNPLGPAWAVVQPVTGSNPATVEWDEGPQTIAINDYATARATSADDVLECWDVELVAGVSYRIRLAVDGDASVRLYLFRNPASSPAWIPLSGAAVELLGTSPESSIAYTAPADDRYGIVVVNDNGGVGTYTLRIESCLLPNTLTSGSATPSTQSPTAYVSLPSDVYWSATAVRALDPEQDWDLGLWRNYVYGQASGCFSNAYATSSQKPGKADVVVVDYNFTPLDAVFVESVPIGSANEDAVTEWDHGANLLSVGGPPVVVPTGPDDVITIWDIFLTGGVLYNFALDRQGIGGPPPDGWLLLFRNANGPQPYVASREMAVVQTQTVATYTPPSTGYYGLAVVNDDGGVGEYSVRVFRHNAVDVPQASPAWVTRLDGMYPNPLQGAARITFELAQPARVSFEMIDLAGRIRARIPEQEFAAGPGVTAWSGGPSSGAHSSLGSGMYFVRMVVDGRAAGTARFVVL